MPSTSVVDCISDNIISPPLPSSSSSNNNNSNVFSYSSQQNSKKKQCDDDTSTTTPVLLQPKSSSLNRVRKNSLEMFLSQSPSQALGSEYLKSRVSTAAASSSSPPVVVVENNDKHLPPIFHNEEKSSYNNNAPMHFEHPQGYFYPGQYTTSTTTSTNGPPPVMMQSSSSYNHHPMMMHHPPPPPLMQSMYHYGASHHSHHSTSSSSSYYRERAPTSGPQHNNNNIPQPLVGGASSSLYHNAAQPGIKKNANIPCKFYNAGNCRMGNKCKFSHDNIVKKTSSTSTTSSSTIKVGSVVDPELSCVTLSEIKGKVVELSRDQNGCRLLQEQFDNNKKSIMIEVIISESTNHFCEMMSDPFGNYLFQKILLHNNNDNTDIIKEVCPAIVRASLDLHGTRSVQKIIQVVSGNCEKEGMVISAIQKNVTTLCVDANGNHVIQRILSNFNDNSSYWLYEAIANDITVIGTQRHGCCVIQRALDNAMKNNTSSNNFLSMLLSKITTHAMQLMQDPFGNYVVQYVLDNALINHYDISLILRKPLGHLYELSVQKFSSNVIEKCLEIVCNSATTYRDTMQHLYLREITNSLKLDCMLQDQFANYVVQRALAVSSDVESMGLVEKIKPLLGNNTSTSLSSGAKRIISRIHKRYPNVVLCGMTSSSYHSHQTTNTTGVVVPPSPHHQHHHYNNQHNPITNRQHNNHHSGNVHNSVNNIYY